MSVQPPPTTLSDIFNTSAFPGGSGQTVNYPNSQGTLTLSQGVIWGNGTFQNSAPATTYKGESVISAIGDVFTLASNLGNGSKVHIVGGMDGTAATLGTGPSFNLYGTINSVGTGSTVWDSTLSSGNITIGASEADGGSIYIERTGGGGAVTVSASVTVT